MIVGGVGVAGEGRIREGSGRKKEGRRTYRVPRIIIPAATEFVTRTPHHSLAGTTKDSAIAKITFLTPLRCRRRMDA